MKKVKEIDDSAFIAFRDSKGNKVKKHGEDFEYVDKERMVFKYFRYFDFWSLSTKIGPEATIAAYEEWLLEMEQQWNDKDISFWFLHIDKKLYSKVMPLLYKHYKNLELSKEDFWECFSHYWTNGRPTHGRCTLVNYFKTNHQLAEQLVTLDFNDDGYIRVYRGENDFSQSYQTFGLSWTYKRDIAERFAIKNGSDLNPRVYSVLVHRDSILAVFDAREECEVVVDASKMAVEQVDLSLAS